MMNFDAFDDFDFADPEERIPSLHGGSPAPGGSSDGSVSFEYSGKLSGSDCEFPNEHDVSSLSDPVETDETRISSSDSSDGMSDMSDDEELDIEFLIAKRRILKRISHVFESEDAWVAATAKKPVIDMPAAIWTDAKEIMSALTEKTGHRQVRFAPSADAVKSSDQVVCKHIRKKCRIDISNVNLVDAKDFACASKTFPPLVEERTESLCNNSKWMIKALQQHYDMPTRILQRTPSPDSTTSSISSSNEVKAKSQKGLSSKIDITCQGTTLEEALAITTTPKILCQGYPPFLVVHANKALFGLSGLSSKDVIGKPVEEIIKIGNNQNDFQSVLDDNTSPINPGLTNGTLGDKICQIQVTPVARSHVLVHVHQQGGFNAGSVCGGSVSSRKHSYALVGTVG